MTWFSTHRAAVVVLFASTVVFAGCSATNDAVEVHGRSSTTTAPSGDDSTIGLPKHDVAAGEAKPLEPVFAEVVAIDRAPQTNSLCVRAVSDGVPALVSVADGTTVTSLQDSLHVDIPETVFDVDLAIGSTFEFYGILASPDRLQELEIEVVLSGCDWAGNVLVLY